MKYKHTYLGEPIGNGIVPFDNLEIRTISNEEIKGLDRFRNGVDWGYGVDPMAFVRWGYDKKKRIIFVLRYWQLMSVKEIMKKCGISKSQIETILCRIRKQLRNWLVERKFYHE